MPKKIAILGAGPIGIEAAIEAAHHGHDVHIYERGEIAAHVRQWGHVELFSPWSMNRSIRGESLLQDAHVTLAAGHTFPTGKDYVERYLEPLATHDALAGRVHTHHEVMGVGRTSALKGEMIADAARGDEPFLVLLRDGEGAQRYEQADVVIDTTGSYRHPAQCGPGGLAVIGADTCDIEHYVPDITRVAARYLGKTTLVVGAGYSAVTTLKALHALTEQDHATRVIWCRRGHGTPYDIIPDDVLPQRAALAAFGNALASGSSERVEPVERAQVMAMRPQEGRVVVSLRHAGEQRDVVVDRVISNVGYLPDTALYRELQVHLCYASEGPMKLAASLLAAGGGGGDCLAQTSAGAETLLNPEPGFFVLGAKSYGRGSAFLLKLGIQQVQEVMELIA